MASKVCGGPTGRGRSNAYFVASLNGGPPGGQSYILGGTGPPWPPCRAATGSNTSLKTARLVKMTVSLNHVFRPK